MNEKILELLRHVQKPGRYIGEEHNAVRKDWAGPYLRVLLAFPDIYEVGMSYLGMRILYGLLNERSDVLCERVFSPWPDMEKQLRDNGLSLFSLESKRPIREFGIIGFSLAYELNYTNVLNILDLGRIPMRSLDRSDEDPLVIAGGPSCYNPEPMADFIDAFVIGDGEEAIIDVVEACKDFFDDGLKKIRNRGALLRKLATLEGVYVPRLYDVGYNGDGTVRVFTPLEGAPPKVRKRAVKDLDAAYYPVSQVVPYIQIVHDRIMLEIMRGCAHLCKFCEAGATCLPRRERSTEKIVELAMSAYRNTGYEEVSLISLSSGDHSRIREICRALHDIFKDKGVSISMPSLRIEVMTEELPQLIREVRKAGITLAPESGSERLRNAIGKTIAIEKLSSTVLEAYRLGWDRIKLYFMIGLPTERDEDLLSTVDLMDELSDARRALGKGPGQIIASIAPFVPKPHTPFQWWAMEPQASLDARQAFLRTHVLHRSRNRKKVKLDFHDLEKSILEGVFSRGDRRLGRVIENAYECGARLDSWGEFFEIGLWRRAFEACGLNPEFYVNRARPYEELLPWDFIDVGIPKEVLLKRAQEQ